MTALKLTDEERMSLYQAMQTTEPEPTSVRLSRIEAKIDEILAALRRSGIVPPPAETPESEGAR